MAAIVLDHEQADQKARGRNGEQQIKPVSDEGVTTTSQPQQQQRHDSNQKLDDAAAVVGFAKARQTPRQGAHIGHAALPHRFPLCRPKSLSSQDGPAAAIAGRMRRFRLAGAGYRRWLQWTGAVSFDRKASFGLCRGKAAVCGSVRFFQPGKPNPSVARAAYDCGLGRPTAQKRQIDTKMSSGLSISTGVSRGWAGNGAF